jgi:hypothetical protein
MKMMKGSMITIMNDIPNTAVYPDPFGKLLNDMMPVLLKKFTTGKIRLELELNETELTEVASLLKRLRES